LCVEGDIETNANVDIGGTATITGAVTLSSTLSVGGDITLENDEVISNSTDDNICLTGGGGTSDEDICFDVDGTNVIALASTTGAVALDLAALGSTLTIDEDQTLVTSTNNKLTWADNSEDFTYEFKTDEVEVSSSTGVVTWGFASMNVDIGAGADITGALTVSTTSDLNGDISAGGGAGALTFDGGAGADSIVIEDNSGTALDIGSTGATDLLRLISTDDAEALQINGYVGADSLHVNVGTMQVDENADFGAGVDVTGAITVSTTSDLNGVVSMGAGAGALTFDGGGGADSIVIEDNSGTSLLIGSVGALNLLTLDTTNDQETLIVTGYTAVDAFHVDVGTVLIDEDVSIGGGASALSLTHSDSSIVLVDNDSTALGCNRDVTIRHNQFG
jgi:hypothetical protein